jgi:peroxiredoxin
LRRSRHVKLKFERKEEMPLKVGDRAPDFELPAVTGEALLTVRLSDYRGKNVVVTFHPLDWTPT